MLLVGRIVSVLKEFQANTRRVTAKQNEIDAVFVLMRPANGQWTSRLNVALLKGCLWSAGFILFDSRFSHSPQCAF